MATANEFIAVYQSERYRSPDSNWSIGIVRGGIAVVGNSEPGELIPGIEYRFIGVHKTHPRYGPQFEFKAFVQLKPHSRQGVVAYLRRYMDGIGISRANAIFDRYGHEAIAVLKQEPERVAAEINGVSLKMAQGVAAALKEGEKLQATRIDLLGILDGSGIPVEKTIDRALKLWGIGAADKIKADPFALLSFPGIAFPTADALYKKLGLPLSDIRRQVAACCWVVGEERGHTWLTGQEVAGRLQQVIDSGLRVDEAIAASVQSGHLVEERGCFADRRNGVAERVVGERLRELVG